ncbi:MAG TPA: ABC transporter ATP-binding protein [Syntrophomonadaceae bacterium]|nr:ABC transporter ATP-binding protein [Syntrophomonadaceae bacterium]
MAGVVHRGIEHNEKPHLMVQNIYKSFSGKEHDLPVLRNITFNVAEHEFVCIVGPSGCGKTTLLRIIAGLETNYQGMVILDEKPVMKPGLERGVVFQEPRLLPWMTVKENIAFALPAGSSIVTQKLIQSLLNLVGLSGFENAYPNHLSGGMAQRVALARALINQPKILLMDEPFGSLDALTRLKMQKEILRIWEEQATTIILVTHDIEEAVYLGDRIIVLSDRPTTIKEIVEIGLPRPRKRADSAFAALRQQIHQEFSGESLSHY